jgi:hypothetical protein
VVSGEVFSMTLESGEALEQFSLYRGRWGALRLTPADPVLPGTGQAEVYRKLAELTWFEHLVPESRYGVDATVSALRGDERRRLVVRDAFVREGLVADDGLPQHDRRPSTYREMH